MIPIQSHEDFSQRRGGGGGGVQAVGSYWTPMAPYGVHFRKQETRSSSSSRTMEELSAASVLMSLTPKADLATKGYPSPPPSTSSLQCFRPREQPKFLTAVVSPSAFTPFKENFVQSSNTNIINNNHNRWPHHYPKLAVVTSSEFESSSSSSSSSSLGEQDYSSDASAADGYLPSSRQEPQPEPRWYHGSISLSLWEDDDFLSPLHCFMRRYCVEAFSASPDDVATPRYGKSHGVRVVVGQVGIRCLYCKHRPVGQRPERAVCFPSSLRNIYHSIETWQRRHSLVCTDIAPWVKKSMMELMQSSKSRAGGRRQYWEDSAMRLGMIDTPQGVRFNRIPGDLGEGSGMNSSMISPCQAQCSPKSSPLSSSCPIPEPVVREQDRQLITDYLFLLMEQMETCQFSEADRTGGRSKIKNNQVGFPGMQCRHCRGKAGLGRYFPSSVDALALANSDRNIYNHVQKCRRCPPQIKDELIRLSKLQAQGCKNKRGLRKLFFKRVWGRIHAGGPSNS